MTARLARRPVPRPWPEPGRPADGHPPVPGLWPRDRPARTLLPRDRPARTLLPGHRPARWLTAAALAGALLASPVLSGCSQPRQGPPARSPATAAPATAGPATTAPATAGPATTAPATAGPATTAPAAADPATRAALLRIAQAFNDAYDNGDFGTVYDRWDARSQRIITRAEYIRRHQVCAPATHVTAVVTGAARAAGGAWHVRYQIGGQDLTDTWFYVRHRWVFDIVLSNPDAARLYRLPFAQYAAATGCGTH